MHAVRLINYDNLACMLNINQCGVKNKVPIFQNATPARLTAYTKGRGYWLFHDLRYYIQMVWASSIRSP